MAEIRSATERDRDAIHALLSVAGLPTADLDTAHARFVVADDGSAVLGAAAIEPYGTTALVRSVVVSPTARNRGLGQALVRKLEEFARAEGFAQLVLLTETARIFFERQGYTVIDRASAPAAVHASAEFRSLCPASATCMSKAIGSGASRSQ